MLKKNIRKRTISILLSITMLIAILCIAPAAASAETPTEGSAPAYEYILGDVNSDGGVNLSLIHICLGIGCNEGELGYWLGVPYWGRGLIPEAAMALIKYGFEGLRLTKIWCGYFEGNEKSRRVQEKCGFRYHHTNEGIECPLMGDIRTEHVTCLTKEAWKKRILKNEMERKQAKRSI